MTVTPLKETNLFKPVKLTSSITLQNRLVLPPLTRLRACSDGVPSDLQLAYYDGVTKEQGTLVITEGTSISEDSGAWRHSPGFWNDRQVSGWKKIVDKVHENKSFISLQLFHAGGAAEVDVLAEQKFPFRGPSEGTYTEESQHQKATELNTPLKGLTTEEVGDLVKQFGERAEKAIKAAGFDIVEVHVANGYLLDEFLQTKTNKRADKYGGSIENRARFVLETIDEVVAKVGIEKVAVRLSPWGIYNGMEGANADPHPVVTHGYIAHELQKRVNQARKERKGNGFAYLSVIEPRVNGSVEIDDKDVVGSNNFISLIYDGFILKAGNYGKRPDLVVEEMKNDKTLIAMGRQYISNPDLHYRLRNNLELTPYDRSTFYANNSWRYTTYGSYGEDELVEKLIAEKQLPKPLA